jgi:hypothetical protein
LIYACAHEIVDDVLHLRVQGTFGIEALGALLAQATRDVEAGGRRFGALLFHLEDGPEADVLPTQMADAWLGCVSSRRACAIIDGAGREPFYFELAMQLVAAPQPRMVFAYPPEASERAQRWCRACAITWLAESDRRRRQAIDRG